MKRLLLPAVLLLAACQPQEIDPARDEAKGAELLAAYEAARAAGDFETAEVRGDELRQRHGDTQAAAKMRETLEQVRVEAEAMRERRRLIQLWDYQANPVEGGIQHSATIYSRVAVDPETGRALAIPDAQLVLRRHPAWGESAYLVLTQKTLECGPPCRLKIRFDDGETLSFEGDPADTGTGPALFIVDRDRFLAAMSEAARVRIELPSSGALVPVFEFEVGGFKPERHLRD